MLLRVDSSASAARPSCSASSRAAVLLFGAVRTSLTIEASTLGPNLLAPLETQTGGPTDVFIHAMLTTAIVNERNGEYAHNLTVSPEQIARSFGPTCGFASDEQAAVDARDLSWARSRSTRNLNALRAWFSLRRAAELVEAHERRRGRLYTLVAAVRSDTAIYAPLTPGLRLLTATPEAVLLPNSQHWGGVNDRFAMGERATMLGLYAKQFDHARTWRSQTENTESFLCRLLARANASVVLADVCVVRVRADAKCVARDLLFRAEQTAPRCLPPGAVVVHAAHVSAPTPCGRGRIPASARGANALGVSGGILVNTPCPPLPPPPTSTLPPPPVRPPFPLPTLPPLQPPQPRRQRGQSAATDGVHGQPFANVGVARLHALPAEMPSEVPACWRATAEGVFTDAKGPSLQHRALMRLLAGERGRDGWDTLFDATFVINVPARAGRRQHVARVLNASRATAYTFHAARDRSSLEREEKRWQRRMVVPAPAVGPTSEGSGPGTARTWRTNLELWPPNRSEFAATMAATPPEQRASLGAFVGNLGKIACLMSHLDVFYHARDHGLETVLIFEDDVSAAAARLVLPLLRALLCAAVHLTPRNGTGRLHWPMRKRSIPSSSPPSQAFHTIGTYSTLAGRLSITRAHTMARYTRVANRAPAACAATSRTTRHTSFIAAHSLGSSRSSRSRCDQRRPCSFFRSTSPCAATTSTTRRCTRTPPSSRSSSSCRIRCHGRRA